MWVATDPVLFSVISLRPFTLNVMSLRMSICFYTSICLVSSIGHVFYIVSRFYIVTKFHFRLIPVKRYILLNKFRLSCYKYIIELIDYVKVEYFLCIRCRLSLYLNFLINRNMKGLETCQNGQRRVEWSKLHFLSRVDTIQLLIDRK